MLLLTWKFLRSVLVNSTFSREIIISSLRAQKHLKNFFLMSKTRTYPENPEIILWQSQVLWRFIKSVFELYHVKSIVFFYPRKSRCESPKNTLKIAKICQKLYIRYEKEKYQICENPYEWDLRAYGKSHLWIHLSAYMRVHVRGHPIWEIIWELPKDKTLFDTSCDYIFANESQYMYLCHFLALVFLNLRHNSL